MRHPFAAFALLLAALALTGCGRPPVSSPTEPVPLPDTKPLIALPPEPRLSRKGYQLILDYEVGGGKGYYEKRLSRPTWPGAASGVTVGVGYDCGYNSRGAILTDWEPLPRGEADRLAGASGIKGVPARAKAAELRDLIIAWGLAETVFNRVSVTRFWELARRTYPGFEHLRPNAQGALLSITFNRGGSLVGDRRYELRMIRDCVATRDYAAMARWNRASIRIWRGTAIEAGMARRREAEAKLIETP